MGINMGGIAAAYQGIRQGQDEEIARQRSEEDRQQLAKDRQHQEGQRQFQTEQQTRARDQWQREDTARTEAAAIPENEPMDAQLRRAAKIKRGQGDLAGALELHGKADEIGFKRSAQKFLQLQATAGNMTAAQLAQQAQTIFNDDPMHGQVTDIVDDGKGGVSLKLVNKLTGQVTPYTFKNRDELANALHAYYSPENFAKMQDERRKMLAEQSKPVAVAPGAKLVRPLDGKVIAENEIGYVDELDAQGNPTGRLLRSGGRGSGSRSNDPLKEVEEHFKFVATDGESKLPAAQLAAGSTLAKQIFSDARAANKPVAKEVAVQAAIDATQDPKLVEPAIEPTTGRIVTIINHPRLGKFEVPSATPPKLDDEKMRLATQEMESKHEPKVLAEMRAAAFGTADLRSNFEQAVLSEVDAAYAKAIAANPKQADLLKAKQQEARKATSEALKRKFELISKYGKKEKEKGGGSQDGAAAAGFSRTSFAPVTTPPTSPVGVAAAKKQLAEQKRLEEQTRQDTQRKQGAEMIFEVGGRLLNEDTESGGSEQTRRKLFQLQSDPNFDLLPQAMKLEIHNRVNRQPKKQ